MEDWEQFFVEKSRRRADKDRAERRRRRTNQIGLAFAIAVLVGSIIALTIVERGL